MTEQTNHDMIEIQGLLDEIDKDESEALKEAETKVDAPELKHDPQRIAIKASEIDASGLTKGVTEGKASDLAIAIMQQFGERTEEIWKILMADRKLIDKYIEIFNDRIGVPENTKGYYVEALTTLLSTKANMSINASRLLDSIAKMTGAIKNMKTDSAASVDLGALLEDESLEEGFDPNNP